MPASKIRLFRAAFPQIAFYAYTAELLRLLADCRSVLDVGCGGGSPLRLLGIEHTVGLDAHGPTLEYARSQQTHSQFVLGRVQDIGAIFPPRRFDAVVALDVIEHLTPQEGRKLAVDMERLARRRIVLFTPNGFVPQQSSDGDLQEHLSGWTPADMRAMGFRVVGMLGHRSLRGECHAHRLRPAPLGGVVSVLSHYLYTRAHPEHAAALLCIREVSP